MKVAQKGYEQSYVDYVKQKYPAVYKAAIDRMQMDGLGFDWSGMFQNFTSAVSQVAPQILQLKQQRDLLKVQTDRAKKGLPPIQDASSYNVPLPYEAGQGAYNVESRFMGMPVKYLLIGGAVLALAFFALRRR